MGIKQLFPKDLLEKPKEERQRYFNEYPMNHTKFKAAVDQVLDFIDEPAGAEVLYLVGPTRGGKTTLLKHIYNRVIAEERKAMEQKPGLIPAIYVLLPNPPEGVFNWKEHFFTEILIALDEVLIDKKVYLPSPQDTGKVIDGLKKGRGSVAAYQRASENALKYRDTKVALFDEGHQIILRRSGEQLKNQSETLKSFAGRSKTLIIIAGTYDLIPLRNLNAQLGNRSVTVYLSNYKYNDGTDYLNFIKILNTFLGHLPLETSPDFSNHYKEIYKLSVGVIGILKHWLSRAYAAALKGNDKTITYDSLIKNAPPVSVSLKTAQEIKEGEARLLMDEGKLADELLQGCLGMYEEKRSGGSSPQNEKGKSVDGKGKAQDTGSISTDPQRRGRGFSTSPKRLLIGG